MRAMSLLFSSARLGVGRPIILAAMLEMRVSLVLFGTVQYDLVQQQQKMGVNIETFKLADD